MHSFGLHIFVFIQLTNVCTLCCRLALVSQELYSACNPIVTKPKPKVELPKEDDKPAEQNGPVDGAGQENATDQGAAAAENTGDAASQSTESKPDMDLD